MGRRTGSVSQGFSERNEVSDQLPYSAPVALDDITGLHFKEIGHVPLLTAEQETALARRMEAGRTALERLRGDPAPDERAELEQTVQDGLVARGHLVCANLRLVVSITKRYIGRGVPFLDLVQEGNIGLMRAASKFDYRLGLRFSTYATWWVRQSVTRAIADQSRTIRVPVHMGEQIQRLLRTAQQLAQELGREATYEELAAALGVPRHKIEDTLKVAQSSRLLEMSDDEGEDRLGDVAADERDAGPHEVVSLGILRGLIDHILQGLPQREASVLRLRYGLLDGQSRTLAEVGRELGVTRERVRQIEEQALRRLRHPTYRRRLRDFVR